MPTAEWGRSSHWIDAIYEGGYYDLFMDGVWIGYTTDQHAQLRWVMEGETSNLVVTTQGKRGREAADIIIEHVLDGVS